MSEPLMIPVDDLDNYRDWYTAKEIIDLTFGQTLIKANFKITDRVIRSLQQREVPYIWVSKDPITKPPEEPDDGEECRRRKNLREVITEIDTLITTQISSGRVFPEVDQQVIDKVMGIVDKVVEAIAANPTAILFLSEFDRKSPYLLQHSADVSYISIHFAVNYSEVRSILRDPEAGLHRFHKPGAPKDFNNLVPLGLAGFLHDIGKIMILDDVNQDVKYKKDDNAIWEKIKMHPEFSHKIFFGRGVSSHSLLGMKYHHENFDGTGYPFGLSGYKIHPYGRILRIVDSFHAAISDRPGGNKKTPEDVCQELEQGAGIQYDPDLVKPFVDMIRKSRIHTHKFGTR